MTTITMDDNTVLPSLESNQRGRVKWFNNKDGYGFITINSELDVFVHHSSIKVENQQYKYLVQGEYVEFNLVTLQDSKHKFQASDVCGINGGKLMCETRREFRISRNNFKNSEPSSSFESNKIDLEPTKLPESVKIPKQTRPSRVRGEGPRDAQKSDWTEVKKKTPVKSVNIKKKVLEEK